MENRICRPVQIEPSVTIEKTVSWQNLGERRVALTVIPRATFLANSSRLAAGDIVGFVSRRENLDFHHAGLVAFGSGRRLMLRHASKRLGRIVDEPMDGFTAANRVQFVTVVRPAESVQWPDAADAFIG